MRVLGQHNLVTWQRWGGILPQLPAGSLLNSLGFVCFYACVYNESIFVLCLLDCLFWGGVMHVFISARHIHLGFIPHLRNDTVQMHSLLKLKYLFTSMSSFMHNHSQRWTLWHILTFSRSLWLFYSHFSPFLVHRLLPNTFVLLLHIHTHFYTHRCPGLSLALRATQNDMCWVPAAWFPLLIHTLALR